MVAVGIAGSRSSVAGVELGLNEEGNKFPCSTAKVLCGGIVPLPARFQLKAPLQPVK